MDLRRRPIVTVTDPDEDEDNAAEVLERCPTPPPAFFASQVSPSSSMHIEQDGVSKFSLDTSESEERLVEDRASEEQAGDGRESVDFLSTPALSPASTSTAFSHRLRDDLKLPDASVERSTPPVLQLDLPSSTSFFDW